MMIEHDDFKVSIKIAVMDTTNKTIDPCGAEMLDDKTVHAIMEQVAKAREVNDE
mgnify:FL=1|jgi:hypothetical protein